MNLYFYGMLFTAGFIMKFLDTDKDDWKSALVSVVFVLCFPFFWGFILAEVLQKKKGV